MGHTGNFFMNKKVTRRVEKKNKNIRIINSDKNEIFVDVSQNLSCQFLIYHR